MSAVKRLWVEAGALLAGLALLGVACSIGYNASTPTAQPTASQQKPVVLIQAPQSGADAVVGQSITVQASGAHPDGVTRLELQANGQTVDSKISQNPSGDQQFSAYLNFTPTAAGSLTLAVIGYRGNIASDPAIVALNVKSQQALVTDTITAPDNGGNQGGYVDPTCRARVEVNGLNFRQGPGQNYPPLAVLPLGTILTVTGHSADLTWWQGSQSGSNTVGWVSVNFITLLGSLCNTISQVLPPASPTPGTTPTATPVPQQVPATPGLPDVAVMRVDGPVMINLDAQNHAVATYRVTIQNLGGPAGTFNVGMQLPDGSLQDMGSVPGLASGQQAIFQTDVNFNAPGSVRLTAVADSKQVLVESDKTNNLKSLDIVLIKASAQ